MPRKRVKLESGPPDLVPTAHVDIASARAPTIIAAAAPTNIQEQPLWGALGSHGKTALVVICVVVVIYIAMKIDVPIFPCKRCLSRWEKLMARLGRHF